MRSKRSTRIEHALALALALVTMMSCSFAAQLSTMTGTSSANSADKGKSPRTITIPDLVGLTERQARDKLAAIGHSGRISIKDNTGCEWRMKIAEGSVCGTHPPAERVTNSRLPITLNIARSTLRGGSGRNAWIAMPDVIGMAPEQAVEVLKKAGFAEIRVQYSTKPKCKPPGKVCYSNPEPGEKSVLRYPKDIFVAVDLSESNDEHDVVADSESDEDDGSDSESDSYFDD